MTKPKPVKPYDFRDALGEKQSRLRTHVENLYELLTEVSNEERMYEGKITDLFEAAGVPLGAYSVIKRVMFDSGVLVLIRRGSRGEPSLIQIVRPPTANDLTLASEAAKITPTVDDISDRLERLEVWRVGFGGINVVGAFKNFERRISQLEERIENLEDELNVRKKANLVGLGDNMERTDG